MRNYIIDCGCPSPVVPLSREKVLGKKMNHQYHSHL